MKDYQYKPKVKQDKESGMYLITLGKVELPNRFYEKYYAQNFADELYNTKNETYKRFNNLANKIK